MTELRKPRKLNPAESFTLRSIEHGVNDAQLRTILQTVQARRVAIGDLSVVKMPRSRQLPAPPTEGADDSSDPSRPLPSPTAFGYTSYYPSELLDGPNLNIHIARLRNTGFLELTFDGLFRPPVFRYTGWPVIEGSKESAFITINGYTYRRAQLDGQVLTLHPSLVTRLGFRLFYVNKVGRIRLQGYALDSIGEECYSARTDAALRMRAREGHLTVVPATSFLDFANPSTGLTAREMVEDNTIPPLPE